MTLLYTEILDSSIIARASTPENPSRLEHIVRLLDVTSGLADLLPAAGMGACFGR